MKTITFIEKRKRFLQAMTLDYVLFPEMELLMDIDFDITSVECHAARDAAGSLSAQFTVGASAESHNVEDVPEQSALVEFAIAISAEGNAVKDVPEIELFDASIGFDVSASEVSTKEVDVSAEVKSSNDISLTPRNVSDIAPTSEMETSTDIVAEGNAVKEITAEQSSEFSMEIDVSVEQLTVKEAPETDTELSSSIALEAECNDAIDAEPKSEMELANSITPYARPRKKATGAVVSAFSNDISVVVCRYAKESDMHGKTLDEFFATGRTLERSLIVPV